MIPNKFKILIAAFSGVFLIGAVSCSKIDDFGDMNTNPTAPLTPLTPGLLTQTLSNFASTCGWDQGGVSTVSGLYCQYFAETQYTEDSRYSKPTTNWDLYYAGRSPSTVTQTIPQISNIKDLQTIIDYNTDPATAPIALAYGSNANQIATARILKAYILWFLTDTWGDIPYNGILNLEDNGVIPYTSQEAVYTSLFQELKDAIAQFDDGDPVTGDILFDGNITMWKKFANSARALMALRLSKVNPGLGATEFNAALSADGGVFEEGQSATMQYPGGDYNSPVYNYYNIVQRQDYAVTDVLIDFLGNNNDYRYFVVGTTTTGFPYGLTRDDAIDFANANPSWAKVVGSSKEVFADGTDFNAATSPFTILGSSEVYLARAEAAFLGWTDESYYDNYNIGIAENFKQWDLYSGVDYDGYTYDGDLYFFALEQDGIALAFDNSDADYEKIMQQTWVAHYPKGWLGWADWRRTGLPELTPAANTKGIPTRFPYGPNEYSLNGANVKAAAAQYTGGEQSADSQYGRVWWDK